ncbi:MAG: ATP-dependent DNA helicase RecG [Candidatus Omnitrophota bacterium]
MREIPADTQNIRYLKGIGPKKEEIFNRLGISTIKDLLYYLPLRYEDRRTITPIKALVKDGFFSVQGKVLAKNLRPLQPKMWRQLSRKSIFEVVIGDGSGILTCVWFNQTYLKDYVNLGDELVLYGKCRIYKGKRQLVAPEFEILGSKTDPSLNLGRIVGFYRLTEGLTQKIIRKILHSFLDRFGSKLNDPIPYYIRKKENIPNLPYSLRNIHFPSDLKDAVLARQRFIYEELFFSQILVYLRKARHRSQRSVFISGDNGVREELEKSMAFKLTPCQEKVVGEIFNDLKRPYPMHRLLQGDVGCGKTIVACFAIAWMAQSDFQAAFMVPTEVLAYQHIATLKDLLKRFNFKIEILTSSLSTKDKQAVYNNLRDGTTDIVIGTHSLVEQAVVFKNLGLVVIDEQHKFGVAQRTLLPKKAKKYAPHCLVMSATPIPRTLSLSLYGDLDLSVIDNLPPGRKQPRTLWVGNDKRRWVYDLLREKLKEKRQAYIIYPVIEESNDWDLRSLREMYDVIKEEFNDFEVAMFHGKMSNKEKGIIIKKFKQNHVNILIATTIIEVGVNIENATVMVVENPERFGLAQLHQLRGRIRRSTYQPEFILIGDAGLSDNAKKRLEIISTTNDGFKIAEEDLTLRGPGDFFGSSQSGFPQLKIASPLGDLEILKQARLSAYRVIKNDPYLREPAHRCIKEQLDFWLKK